MTAFNPPWIVYVDDRDFEREVVAVSHERAVVVDFWAPWCGPCRALTPILEKVIGQHKGEVVLAKVNIDEAPNLATQFQVQGIPLVIAFRDGKPVAEFDGVRPEPFVQQFVQSLMPTEADKLVALARTLENSDPAQAELTYLQALDRDRRNQAAALGLARLFIATGKEKEALILLEDVDPSEEVEKLKAVAGLRQAARPFADEAALRERVQKEPKIATARYELGCVLAAKERYPEALEMLLAAAEGDPKLASSAVREAMVKIFQIVGLHSALANDYRNKLSTLLY
ncbi:MAG TPA: thioredoxin [Gemmataceae bacterium]|nr:thioredoxin [Gemmataceae bacterium]